MFHHVELSQHNIDVDEDDGEAEDEVTDVAPDGARGNVTETVGNVHLHKKLYKRFPTQIVKFRLVKLAVRAQD